MVSGKVISKEKQEVVDFATVYLKGTTYGCTTNEEGIYHLHAPAGKYTLVVSAIGYKTIEKPVTLVHGERIKMNVMIAPSVTELGEVVVVSNRGFPCETFRIQCDSCRYKRIPEFYQESE